MSPAKAARAAARAIEAIEAGRVPGLDPDSEAAEAWTSWLGEAEDPSPRPYAPGEGLMPVAGVLVDLGEGDPDLIEAAVVASMRLEPDWADTALYAAYDRGIPLG